jgi:hypothetical protein
MPNLLLKSSIALTSWQSVMAFNNAEPMLKRLKTDKIKTFNAYTLPKVHQLGGIARHTWHIV